MIFLYTFAVVLLLLGGMVLYASRKNIEADRDYHDQSWYIVDVARLEDQLSILIRARISPVFVSIKDGSVQRYTAGTTYIRRRIEQTIEQTIQQSNLARENAQSQFLKSVHAYKKELVKKDLS